METTPSANPQEPQATDPNLQSEPAGRTTVQDPPSHGTPPPYSDEEQPSASPAITETERAWSVAAHLSGFCAAWFAFGFLGPLIVWLVAGGTSPTVRKHAIEALNFNLSVLLYAAISAVLLIVGIGFVLLPLVGLLYVVASLAGAVAASQDRDFRYPFSLRLIH